MTRRPPSEPRESDIGPIAALARAARLCLHGRVHFPRNRIGAAIQGEGQFVVFRQLVLRPHGDSPALPLAIFVVRFRFARFSPGVNRLLSAFPTPFILGQPGFRSKLWAMEPASGDFMGLYEWDTLAAARAYRDSFPMRLLRRRAVPATFVSEIRPVRAEASTSEVRDGASAE